MILRIFVALWMIASVANAQILDCGAQGCTDTVYGLGSFPGDFTHTIATARLLPGDGSCGAEFPLTGIYGQLVLREQNGCEVSASQRCVVEVPTDDRQSGITSSLRTPVDLGPLGTAISAINSGSVYDGNLAFRALHGSCTQDGGERCQLDADCSSQAGCRSTCAANPGTLCSSDSDCPSADQCVTEVDFDDVGRCSDGAGPCSADADCTGGAVCDDGLVITTTGCNCCQSSTGTTCAIVTEVEYPELSCPVPTLIPVTRAIPALVFEGGAGTAFSMERALVPGQQEGVCALNRFRPCGARGDVNVGGTCDDMISGGLPGDVCDLSENGYRTPDIELNLDGTPNPGVCSGALIHLAGVPNALCSIPQELLNGDPLPGCALLNFGADTRPDLDCNNVDDTTEGRCHPDGATACATDADCGDLPGSCITGGDLCPFLAERRQFLDSNGDGRGDECQCGDAVPDGSLSALDIAGTAQCANNAIPCDSTIVDANGDIATTAIDIGAVAQAVNGVLAPTALECVRSAATAPF